jgi:hypothetical protein
METPTTTYTDPRQVALDLIEHQPDWLLAPPPADQPSIAAVCHEAARSEGDVDQTVIRIASLIGQRLAHAWGDARPRWDGALARLTRPLPAARHRGPGRPERGRPSSALLAQGAYRFLLAWTRQERTSG